MNKEQPEKLDEWILACCYLKTVRREIPAGWMEPRGKKECEWYYIEYPELSGLQKYMKEFGDYLFPSEVLLNFFGLERSVKFDHGSYINESFMDTVEYRNALERYVAALVRLEERGLVNVHPNTGMTLTEKGKEAALQEWTEGER